MKRVPACFLVLILLLAVFQSEAQTADTAAMEQEASSQENSSIYESLLPEDVLKGINPFMHEAIREALKGIFLGHGGPFGAVVVRNGEIVGQGHNQVLTGHDPTRHGEIDAIRDACSRLNTHDLNGCELYTTGQPCPMCLFACLWANIDKVYFGCTIEDTALIGFRDESFDQLIGSREMLTDYLICMDRDACLALYESYQQMEHQLY